MTRTKLTGLLLGILAVAPAGCQGKPEFVPVEGTVTQGGKPLAGVIVEFHPEAGPAGLRSAAATDEAGRYRLRGHHGEDGAVVGTHRVCIFDTRGRLRDIFGRLPKDVVASSEVQEKMKALKELDIVSSRIPTCYGRPNETPLRLEVRPGEQVIDLHVK